MKKYMLVILAVLVTAAGLPLIHLTQTRLEDSIRENRLLGQQFAEDGGAPPGVAISTVFLGGFRNLLANALWLRMTRLQEKGNYFELVQLANWILKVQPRNATAAQYLAWNMAYNLSIIQQDNEGRWRWVSKGIGVLRHALELSPNDPALYKDLAWIYQNKVGDQFDVAGPYFRYRLADENYRIFAGKHTPDWAALAESPATLSALLKQDPALRRKITEEPEKLLKDYVASGALPEKLKEKLTEQEQHKVLLSLQNEAIRTLLGINPAEALKLEKKYGKFDWLLPDSFAAYWANLGVEQAAGKRHLPCERIRSHALKILFTSGRVIYPEGKPSIDSMRLPNFSLADAALKSYADETELMQGNTNMGHLTFIAQAVDMFYLFGKQKEAEKYYNLLKEERYPEAKNKNLQQFVDMHLRRMIAEGTHLQVMGVVESFIIQSAYFSANGERDEAAQALLNARRIYEIYLKRTRSEEERVRLRLPTFKVLTQNITENLMRNVPALGRALKAEIEAGY